MLRWLDDGGASIDLLRFEGGQFHTRRDVATLGTIFEIPLRHLMTTETALASAIGRAVAATHLQPSSATSLALFLLEEMRAADSFWRPYLATLPRRLPQIPLFFSDRELALLEGSSVLANIRNRRESLAAEYTRLCDHVGGIDSFSLEQFLVAHALVDSRAFTIDVFGVRTLAMVPLADLIDHHPHPGTSWHFEDDRASFVLGTTEPLTCHAAVRDSYGAKGNLSLFDFYGFVLDDESCHDAVIGIGDQTFTIKTDVKAEATRELFAALADFPDPARELLEVCARALQRFPTTLERDRALLASTRLSRNERNAILARMSEKRVLDFFARFASEPGATDRIAPLQRFRDRQWSDARNTA